MRTFRVFVVLALAAAPALARPGGVNLYPFAGDGIEERQLHDLEGMLKSALLRLRSPTLTLDSLDTLEPACGKPTQAKPPCLARFARSGVVLTGNVTRSGRYFQIAVTAIDGQGRAIGPVKPLVDPAVENLQPIVGALQELDSLIAGGAQAQPAVATQTPPPVRPRVPAEALEPERPRSEVWLGRAALGAGAGAIASAGGALALGYLAKKTNQDLTNRYATHALTVSDAAAYGNVKTYSNFANILFIASGVLAAGALTCWAILADDDSGSSLSRL